MKRNPLNNLQAICILFSSMVIVTTSSCVKTVVEPRSIERRPTIFSDHPVAVPGRLTNLNTATREELAGLPGIGQTMAARIIAHRERYGPFRRAEHLMMVRGISDRRFRQLRALVSVE